VTTEVRRDDAQSRYELLLDGQVVGLAEFRDDGDRLVFPHTVIDAPLRGRGLGDVLVKGALDDVRARGERVVPTCWFVAEYIDSHREYADLVAR
jgi:predicted GNAT family acetyltransferase